MPELNFTVRWPDGSEQTCYSPSLVVHDHLALHENYDVADFLSRVTTALTIAGERVQAKYGFACTSAMATIADVQRVAAAFAPEAAPVTVTGFTA